MYNYCTHKIIIIYKETVKGDTMLNRLYTVIDKSVLCDPDGILLSAFDYIEIVGEIEKSTLEKIKGYFACAAFDGNVPTKGVQRVDIERRAGRFDRDTEEIKSVLALLKKNNASAMAGREFYFSEGADKRQIDAFLKENVNAYVFAFEGEKEPAYEDSDEKNSVKGFCEADYTELSSLRAKFGLKMEIDDLMCVQNYFISESREPSLAEIKIVDNFFSENFRHTTFETNLDRLETDDPYIEAAWGIYRDLRDTKAPSLSDITMAAQDALATDDVVKATKKLNAISINTAENEEKYLLITKNESHNRSTTAVPYDGAAGCLNGAIKDIFCAFGYPYDSYRTVCYGKTEKSRKDAALSATGYAENASAVGVPCTKCDEAVSPIYDKKYREVCNVLAVAKREHTAKALAKEPSEGDKLYILGSKTGADGTHCSESNLKRKDSVGEYIPTSNSSELAALQRLFVNEKFAEIAIAINDVSSGGIVCSLGEIVDGADIYIAGIVGRYGISVSDAILGESNERMIVCVRDESSQILEDLCKKEGVGCFEIGQVNDDKRFVIYDEHGTRIASLTEAFLLSGGAEKHLVASAAKESELPPSDALEAAKAPLMAVNPLKKLLGPKIKHDFERACLLSAEKARSQRAELAHRFNGVASGDISGLGKAFDVSVRKLNYNGRPVLGENEAPLYSALACGSVPEISGNAPYKGAYLSVIEAITKLIAAGYGDKKVYLSLQEYFPRHKNSSKRLGVSVASMLGCFKAQMELGIPSIGGRISIGSGEGENDACAVVNAFAFCLCEKGEGIGSAFEKVGSKVVLFAPDVSKGELPDGEAIKELSASVTPLIRSGAILSASVVNAVNPCTVIMEMCRYNKKGVMLDATIDDIFDNVYAGIICEMAEGTDVPKGATLIGTVTDEHRLQRDDDVFELGGVLGAYEKQINGKDGKRYLYLKETEDSYGSIKPVNESSVRVLIPMTAQTVAVNDVKAAFEMSGAAVKLLPLTPKNITELVKQIDKCDILFIPDSLGNIGFISALLEESRVRLAIGRLRERNGLVYGSGNAFGALITSGILELDKSKISFSSVSGAMINEKVGIKVTSTRSAFTRKAEVGKVYEGYVTGKRLKLVCTPEYADELAKDGLIITQYDVGSNAPDADMSIDSVCSPDGCVVGQISRVLSDGNTVPIIRSAVDYFSIM